MKKRILFTAMLGVALVFAATMIAHADTALTLSANPTVISYPHASVLTVGFPTADPATATVFAMPVGGSTWTTVSASVTSTLAVRPRVSTLYKASIDGTESAPVTVTVKARLTKAQLPGSIRRNRTRTIRGSMAPGERNATVKVEVFRHITVLTRVGKGRLKKSTAWALYSSQTVALRYYNKNLSVWSLRWKPTELGYYKVVVSHEDVAHARSATNAYTRVRR